MRHTSRLWLLIAFLMASCAGTAPTQFYVLTALPSSERIPPLPGDKRNLAVGIGPVELPRYLDQPQIATRLSPTTLSLSEFHRWAEPLKDSVSRVLAQNLSNLLTTDYIAIYPWARSTSVDYQVGIDLIHFEGTFGEQSVLEARWYILDAKRERELMRNTSSASVPVDTKDYKTLVAAMSQTLEKLSRDIAVALRALAQHPSTG
jgi:uncharacterized lipoprotein YmbA